MSEPALGLAKMLGFSDKTAGSPALPASKSTAAIIYQKKVMIILPWHKNVSPMTAFCVAQLIDRRRTATLLNWGDAFISHTRNHCAEIFLNSECDYALWLDDDMVLPFGNAQWYRSHTGFDFPEEFMGMNTLDRLMSHQKTLVGGLYFGRHLFGPPVTNEGSANPAVADYYRKGPYDKIQETRWVGTGCLLTHRSVFTDIEKVFPRLARRKGESGGNWFTSTEASLLDQVARVRDGLAGGPITAEKGYEALRGLEEAIALAQSENSLGVGEDVSFCLRAKAAGHTPYVDLGLICGHIGHCVYGPKNTANKPKKTLSQ
jgi:hypothetical protein